MPLAELTFYIKPHRLPFLHWAGMFAAKQAGRLWLPLGGALFDATVHLTGIDWRMNNGVWRRLV